MDHVLSESEIRTNVINDFHALQQSISALKAALYATPHAPCWAAPAPTHLETNFSSHSDLERISQFVSQLEYLPGQDPREILVLPAILAGTPKVIEAAYKVNDAKHEFKRSILTLKDTKISLHDSTLQEHFETLLGHSTPSARRVLRKMGLARLHLKQCYRTIPILVEPPHKISWTWAHTRSIKRISKEEADAMLSKRGKDAGIEIQRHKLAALPAHEKLAIVQELAPHLRANLVFYKSKRSGMSDEHRAETLVDINDSRSEDNIEVQRMMIKGAMPLLYPWEPLSTLPKIKCPSEKQQKNSDRRLRADVKLDPIAFLPAIHAHRYLS